MATDERRSLVRHLTVLRDEADQTPVPKRKFFAIGNPALIDGYGETLPLLSFIDDNLSRFVISNAALSSWGRVAPAPFVYALPNIAVKARDGIFLVSGEGQDRVEAHPSGESDLKIVFLNQKDRLWSTGLPQVFLYRIDGIQSKRVSSAQ